MECLHTLSLQQSPKLCNLTHSGRILDGNSVKLIGPLPVILGSTDYVGTLLGSHTIVQEIIHHSHFSMASVETVSLTLLILCVLKFLGFDFFLVYITSDASNEPIDLYSLNGFYGPGVYWGWFLTCISLLLRFIWKGVEAENASRQPPYRRFALDGDLIGAVLITLFAFIDFCRHLPSRNFQSSRSGAVMLSSAGNFAILALVDAYLLRRKPHWDREFWSKGLAFLTYWAWIVEVSGVLANPTRGYRIAWLSKASVVLFVFVFMSLLVAVFTMYWHVMYMQFPKVWIRGLLMMLLLGAQMLTLGDNSRAAVLPMTMSTFGDLYHISALSADVSMIVYSWSRFLPGQRWWKPVVLTVKRFINGGADPRG